MFHYCNEDNQSSYRDIALKSLSCNICSMPPPLVSRLSPETAFLLGDFKARYEMADADVRTVFHDAALALAWSRFIADFGASGGDLNRTSLTLTQSTVERHFFLDALVRSDDWRVRDATRPLANMFRTSAHSRTLPGAKRLLTSAVAAEQQITVANPVSRVIDLVLSLRQRPYFAEGTAEYQVLRNSSGSLGFTRSGQRAAAWAANLALGNNGYAFLGVTPLPCYGLITREMLRPDVRSSALPELVDAALGSVVGELGTRLDEVRRALPAARALLAEPEAGDQRLVIARYLIAFGSIRSAHLPALTGKTRSSLSRALARMVNVGFCSTDRSSGVVRLQLAPSPRVGAQPVEFEIGAETLAEFEAALAGAERINQRFPSVA
jgi:hypothetical protein